MEALRQLAARFKEPSSWAGIAGIMAIFGVHLDPGILNAIIVFMAGFAGLLAVIIPEKK